MLFDLDLVAVVPAADRPSEEEIIADGLRQVTAVDITVQARADIAFAHLRTVLVQDERNVSEAQQSLRARGKVQCVSAYSKVIITG